MTIFLDQRGGSHPWAATVLGTNLASTHRFASMEQARDFLALVASGEAPDTAEWRIRDSALAALREDGLPRA
jgi:hypothetical protein